MRFEKLVAALLVGVLFILGGMFIITEQSTRYDYEIENEVFANVTQEIDAIYGNASNQKDSLSSSPISEGDTEDNLFKAGYNMITNTWTYFTGIGRLIEAVAIALGIPNFIVTIFMTILLVSGLFTIVYMIFRFQPRG